MLTIIIKKHYGFTLVELAITLSIIAILAAMASPSFISIIQNNRMTTQYNELLAHLSFARSEAITRDSPVTICQSSSDDKDECTEQSNNWQAGWIVFVDLNSNYEFDSDEETILRIHDALSGGNTLNFAGGSHITYLGTALMDGATDGIFTLCGGHNGTQKRLVVSTTGRVRHDNDDLAAC